MPSAELLHVVEQFADSPDNDLNTAFTLDQFVTRYPLFVGLVVAFKHDENFKFTLILDRYSLTVEWF